MTFGENDAGQLGMPGNSTANSAVHPVGGRNIARQSIGINKKLYEFMVPYSVMKFPPGRFWIVRGRFDPLTQTANRDQV